MILSFVSPLVPSALRFNNRLMRLVGLPLIGFFIPLLFLHSTLSGGLAAYWPQWALATFYTLVYWEGNRLIFLWSHARFPTVDQTPWRIGWLLGLAISFTLLAGTVLTWATAGWLPHWQISSSLAETYLASLIPVVTSLAIYEGIFYFRQFRTTLLEAQQLKQENLQAQLDALRHQVNPHFLFNSLNTLATLIPEDADLAVRFVQKLASVYRHILVAGPAQTVCLRDELWALQAYAFLLQIRFGSNLSVSINLPEACLDNQIVPLTLQMLLENAVKHNIVSAHRPLLVELYLVHDRLLMRNKWQPKPAVLGGPNPETTGLGLRNIQNRYQLLANESVIVTTIHESFIVSLPLLPPLTHEHTTA